MARMGSNALVPFLVLFLALVTNSQAELHVNHKPIIGILTQKPPGYILDHLKDHNFTAFIAAPYVKYIESAGGRVAPIFIHEDEEYYTKMASSVNGILFPGGGVPITNSSGYGAAGWKLYHHAVKAYQEEGIYLPIWGTCLGFQMLTYLAAHDTSWLSACSAKGKSDNLIMKYDFMDSRLFSHMPNNVIDYFRYYETTYNHHGYCITPKSFTDSGLSNDFKMLTTSLDYNGVEYMSLMEHKEIPIFGSQFHPEQNLFGWKDDSSHIMIPHDKGGILTAQYLADFFTNQARQNNQTFATEQEEQEALIYNYDPYYTGSFNSAYSESYLFRPRHLKPQMKKKNNEKK